MTHFTNLFDVPQIIHTYGYVGICLIVFLESGIFFALPGDSLLFTAGLFASAFGLHLYFLVPMIFLATFLGGQVGYEIGVHIEKLRRYNFFKKMLKEEHIAHAHEFFITHGRFAIVFSRFIPILRTFTPIVAGVAKVPYGFYTRYSLISSILWSTIVTSIGFFLGSAFPQIKDYLSVIVILVVFVSCLPLIIEFIQKRKKA